MSVHSRDTFDKALLRRLKLLLRNLRKLAIEGKRLEASRRDFAVSSQRFASFAIFLDALDNSPFLDSILTLQIQKTEHSKM